MSWIGPIEPLLRGRRPNLAQPDRHRPGYFKDYYGRNVDTLRPYKAAKQRQYRRSKRQPFNHRGKK